MTSPTRVLVTGASGQVGVDLVDILSGAIPLGADATFQPDGQPVGDDEFIVLALSRRDLDVTDRDAVAQAIDVSRPDVIVHLAAYTAVDRAENDVESCYAVNATATESLSIAAHDAGAHLITISTDYVFDGTKGTAYVEDDDANPLNVYGGSKLAGELLCSDEDTVVRTSWVMGVRGKNVLHVIADRAASGANVRFVNDQTGTVTLAADLARALVTMVRQRPGGVWRRPSRRAISIRHRLRPDRRAATCRPPSGRRSPGRRCPRGATASAGCWRTAFVGATRHERRRPRRRSRRC